MSRSRKKRPYGNYHCLTGQKEAKRIANRNMRRICKQVLHVEGEINVDILFPTMDEVCNVWSMPMDGRQYYRPFEPNRAEKDYGDCLEVILHGKPLWFMHYKWIFAK